MGHGAAGARVVQDAREQPPRRRLVLPHFAQERGEVAGGQLLEARVAEGDKAQPLEGRRPSLVARDLAEHVPLAHLQHALACVGAGPVLIEP